MEKIRLLILDVDGTLTDGRINISEQGELFKAFYAKDGLVLTQLENIGITPVIITGRTSSIVECRARELHIHEIHQGISDKLNCCAMILERLNVLWKNVLYIGDDLNDFKCMRQCGVRACPQDAIPQIKNICTYVSRYKGGHGAVRDCIETILKITGQWEELERVYTGL